MKFGLVKVNGKGKKKYPEIIYLIIKLGKIKKNEYIESISNVLFDFLKTKKVINSIASKLTIEICLVKKLNSAKLKDIISITLSLSRK
jgi:DNA invertase Pin-like site-specific DNA recombinase